MDPSTPETHARLSRRTLVQRAGLGAAALAGMPALLAACGGDSGGGGATTGATSAARAGESPELTKLLDGVSGDQVVIGSFGGTTEDARRAAFWDPFTERTGVEVVTADLPGNLGENMIMGRVKPRMDAYHASAYQVLRALDEGARPLPETPAVAHEDLIPEEFQPYSFQSFFLAYVPAMLPGTYSGDQPSTWADFFDTRKFPGKRAWPGPANTPGTREAALMADGVPPDEVFPLDLERANAKIASLLDDMVVYNEFPQAQSFLTSKTAAMSFGANGLWKGMQDKGVDVTVLWDMAPILQQNGMAPLPDSPNPANVMALAAFCSNAEGQAEFARLTNYGPPSRAAFDAMSDEEVRQMPNAPGREVCMSDPANLAELQAQMLEDNKKLFS